MLVTRASDRCADRGCRACTVKARRNSRSALPRTVASVAVPDPNLAGMPRRRRSSTRPEHCWITTLDGNLILGWHARQHAQSDRRTLAMNTLGPQGSQAETVARLNALAAELTAHGWTASVREPRSKPPTLHAHNPEPGAAALSEHIYARPRIDGTWTYWWPWIEPIADTPADAAAVIVRVLRPAIDTIRSNQTGQRVERSAKGDAVSDRLKSTPGQPTAPSRDRANSNADLEVALREAERFLARSCAAVHSGRTLRMLANSATPLCRAVRLGQARLPRLSTRPQFGLGQDEVAHVAATDSLGCSHRYRRRCPR